LLSLFFTFQGTAPAWNAETGGERQTHVNHLGHFYLTHKLFKLLKAGDASGVGLGGGGRIVQHSSLASMAPFAFDRDDLSYKKRVKSYWFTPMKAYSQSKRANVLFTWGLNERFGNLISATTAHPGFTRTELLEGVSTAPKWAIQLAKSNELFTMSSRDGCKSLLKAGFNAASKANDFFGPAYGMFGPAVRIGSSYYAFPALAPSSMADVDGLWEYSMKAYGIKEFGVVQ
jgi:NAD(P)-dependent dehydrogenase (short-subunit alcohol dehydrogenase family)